MFKTMICGAALLVAASVAAQNFDEEPNYGSMDLTAGFDSDPRVVAVQAGGSSAASNAGSNCTGFISHAPDLRLNYSAGSLPLIISADALSDTTLVVNGPDGSWYCDDDGGVNGSNPAIRFNNPASGRYEIWVGTYRSGDMQPARLHISEISSQ